ncbi:MAG: penicillin-binding transpeptidase domain-containing protein [Eubacteriales bacterium]|nr:penicillin-binding transpeptidase domain-containing protein [Eubacteriales bacterium]
MWRRRKDPPGEGGVRIPDTQGKKADPEAGGEVYVESVRHKARLQIVFTAVLFSALFVVMTVCFCRYAIANRRVLFDNDYNERDALLEEHNRRGRILAYEDGELRELAVSDNENHRTYPYGEQFCHVVGFSAMGGSGIDEYMKYELLHSDIPFESKLVCDSEEERYPGNDVYTTLDVTMQKYAYEAMTEEGHYGAVIVTEPSTGKILAMVSTPGFEPDTVSEEWYWDYLRTNQSGNSQLVNRATQGLYAPGSTFKIVDAIELLQEDPSAIYSFRFDCVDGEYSYDGENIHCFEDTRTHRYEVHGKQTLAEAFAHSCNSAFSKIVTEMLDEKRFRKTLKKLLFDSELPYDLPYSESHSQLLEDGEISVHNLMQVAIGQGTTGVSPLHMNMITMAVANGGVLMRPYLIDRVCTAEDVLLQQYNPRQAAALMDSDTADMVRQLMRSVTQVTRSELTGRDVWGTASEFADTREYYAFGKTGTAEFGDDNDSHAWFTGFSVDAENTEDGKPDLCITVLIENGGVGSDKAVPVAKKILDRWYGE